MPPKKYYAVFNGRNKGIYSSWNECKGEVNGFKGAEYKGFNSKAEADSFMKVGYGNRSRAAPSQASTTSRIGNSNNYSATYSRDTQRDDSYGEPSRSYGRSYSSPKAKQPKFSHFNPPPASFFDESTHSDAAMYGSSTTNTTSSFFQNTNPVMSSGTGNSSALTSSMLNNPRKRRRSQLGGGMNLMPSTKRRTVMEAPVICSGTTGAIDPKYNEPAVKRSTNSYTKPGDPTPLRASKSLTSNSQHSEGAYTLHADGGARGNPGRSGCGSILRDPSGAKVFETSQFLAHGTNNEAEFYGVMNGLKKAKEYNNGSIKKLNVFLDSKMIVNQLNGDWQVKDKKLQPLFQRTCGTLKSFDMPVSVKHVRREYNKDADRLANDAMDSGRDSEEYFM
eukprot:TRINITY_DN167486_c0_g1_i1.p1 TRINITY_DN167486_c0_g1~~TRINITY_DN167486_c0_g1_i1.p1  ORF type:complete len:391 (-),score=66.57 TRINITY_DN167486_c0_g1_i1:74-1246(-)